VEENGTEGHAVGVKSTREIVKGGGTAHAKTLQNENKGCTKNHVVEKSSKGVRTNGRKKNRYRKRN